MNAVSIAHLRQLYQDSVDPWHFRSSVYERNKFKTSIECLGDQRYESVLEIGCGNGEFGRLLRSYARRYCGMDAVATAIAEARHTIPDGVFYCDFFPCSLPRGNFDLVVLSEFLYFLDEDGIAELAKSIRHNWAECDILTVNYLGPSGNKLQGGEAQMLFKNQLSGCYQVMRGFLHRRYIVEMLTPKHQ